MAKKRSKSTTAAGDVPIQYRPGQLLADLIETYSVNWQVTRNEGARRLAALAVHGLDVRHHDLVCEFAERTYGQGDFTETCQRIHIELQAADTARCKVGSSPMTEDERQTVIQEVVRNYILLHRDPEEPTKERVQIGVYEK